MCITRGYITCEFDDTGESARARVTDGFASPKCFPSRPLDGHDGRTRTKLDRADCCRRSRDSNRLRLSKSRSSHIAGRTTRPNLNLLSLSLSFVSFILTLPDESVILNATIEAASRSSPCAIIRPHLSRLPALFSRQSEGSRGRGCSTIAAFV